MVGEARPREGMLGNRTEPGKAIQGCSALCRPAERERATGTLPRCREARDIQRTKGEKAPEDNLQVLNIRSDVDLKQHRGFGTGRCSERNRDTEATPRHGGGTPEPRHRPQDRSQPRNITSTQNRQV